MLRIQHKGTCCVHQAESEPPIALQVGNNSEAYGSNDTYTGFGWADTNCSQNWVVICKVSGGPWLHSRPKCPTTCRELSLHRGLQAAALAFTRLSPPPLTFRAGRIALVPHQVEQHHLLPQHQRGQPVDGRGQLQALRRPPGGLHQHRGADGEGWLGAWGRGRCRRCFDVGQGAPA